MKPELSSILADVSMVEEKGVFMEVLEKMLIENNIDIPFIGINEEHFKESLFEIREFIVNNSK